MQIDHVRLLPDHSIGHLLISSHSNSSIRNIQWIDDNDSNNCSSLNLAICQEFFVDFDGQAIVIVYDDQNQDQKSKMLNFIEKEGLNQFLSLIRGSFEFKEEQESRGEGFALKFSRRKSIDEDDGEEAFLNVMEVFAKIPTALNTVYNSFMGDQRPRGNHDARTSGLVPKNPWIWERPLELPDSTVSTGEIAAVIDFDKLPLQQRAVMVYNSAGKILKTQESRRLFWRDILNTYKCTNEAMHIENPASVKAEWRDRIQKDLPRLGVDVGPLVLHRLKAILEAYSVYDDAVGYVQGMSDLALPFARLYEDLEEAFRAFMHFMTLFRDDFLEGTQLGGIQKDLNELRSLIDHFDPVLNDYFKFNRDNDCLYFTYRWFLVSFRREFNDSSAVDRLWDVMMASTLTFPRLSMRQYRLFFAFAMIWSQREVVLRSRSRFEDVYQIFNDKCAEWDVDELIVLTDKLLKRHQNSK